MRLQVLEPPLPQALIDALAICEIKTDTDLLFSDSPIEIFRKLPNGTVSLQEFLDSIAQVTEQAAAPAIQGDQLLQKARKRRENDIFGDLSSGVPILDALLGGLRPPRVVEISGDRGSGKTAFALQVVIRHLASVYDSGALWIDTSGDFSAERLSILLQAHGGEAGDSILERLQIALAFDVDTALEVLEQLRLSFGADPQPEPIVRCVVIDAVTPLLGPLLSAVSSQGHALMTSFMRQLRTLAEEFSLTVLVINSSTQSNPHNHDAAFLTNDRKPALGPSFTFLTDTTLWLSKCVSEDGDMGIDSTTHIAEILRSRTTPSQTWCKFKIRDGILTSE